MPHQTAVRSVCTSVQKRPAQALRRRLSRRRLIFLVGAARHDLVARRPATVAAWWRCAFQGVLFRQNACPN